MTPIAELLHFGRAHPLHVLLFEPMFEEANRTRRLFAEMARALDRAGIGVTFAELEGMGEDTRDSSGVSLEGWRTQATALAIEIKPTVIASARGGALIDGCGDTAKGWWRFAPETGARTARDLRRTKLAGNSGLYAGHALDESLLTALDTSEALAVARLRTVRLASDAQPADVKIEGSPMWRRAEPGEDAALSAALAADLADWTRQCASG